MVATEISTKLGWLFAHLTEWTFILIAHPDTQRLLVTGMTGKLYIQPASLNLLMSYTTWCSLHISSCKPVNGMTGKLFF